jgi:3-deoxy-manno-octulosonate cytidylyltransferase (CMP-KDO synthetase)
MRARALAVIPARFASTRLPGKPLLPILGGDPMIVHVIRRALAAKTIDRVLVATDHEEIAAAARAAGAEAVMTDSSIATGTDRVAEAMRLTGATAEVVVNVQGDEPLIAPEAIDCAAELLLRHAHADIATLSTPLPPAALLDPSKVKVVCAAPKGQLVDADLAAAWALFFSRAPIGMDRKALLELLDHDHDRAPRRDASPASSRGVSRPHGALSNQYACRLHVGLYAFRPQSLERFVSLPPTQLEQFESLEQLRALESGMRIIVGEVASHAQGVDTMDDLRILEEQHLAAMSQSHLHSSHRRL